MNELIMPVIFIGHGSPMTVISKNQYQQAWQNLSKDIIKPKAILVISAHWNINETAVSDLLQPEQIYDFYGFPEELYAIKYCPLGNPELARRVISLLSPLVEVKINNEWGIDHGAWVPLNSLFPEADVPVVQLSLDYSKSPDLHYKIGQALKILRNEGVLIIGSGDIVHNLEKIKYDEASQPYPWAQNFENLVLQHIADQKHGDLINYLKISPDAQLAIPSLEHYLPMLYILGLQEKDETVHYFVKGIAHGSVSMTSFIIK